MNEEKKIIYLKDHPDYIKILIQWEDVNKVRVKDGLKPLPKPTPPIAVPGSIFDKEIFDKEI